MGNFWGFQEAWLSPLAASIFDMAAFLPDFVRFLSEADVALVLARGITASSRGFVRGGLSVRGAEPGGHPRWWGITSLWLFFLLSLPFGLIVLLTKPVKPRRCLPESPMRRRPERVSACLAQFLVRHVELHGLG